LRTNPTTLPENGRRLSCWAPPAISQPGLRRGGDAPLSPPNETIQKAREAALAVLKPSPKDLEHGFDLHAHSLVFESYGFAPARPDGDLIRKRLEAGAPTRS